MVSAVADEDDGLTGCAIFGQRIEKGLGYLGKIARSEKQGRTHRHMLQMVAPGILQQVKTGVLQAVSSGRLGFLKLCGTGLFGGSNTKECSVLLESVTKQDKFAKVAFTVTKDNGVQSVRFVVWMQPRESHWQVVSVENLQELLLSAPALLRD